jgi:hypothetical protein
LHRIYRRTWRIEGRWLKTNNNNTTTCNTHTQPFFQVKSHCDWRSVSQSVSLSVQIVITVWQLRSCYCGAPSESESYITTDGQSASLSWNKAPIWGLRPDLDYCQTFAGLLMWGFLSDARTDLSFAIATGTRQRSHFRVRVPWDSRPHFTVSDSRLPFLSPPTTRRATVEVFDPASTREGGDAFSDAIFSYITLSRTYRKHFAVRIVVGFV